MCGTLNGWGYLWVFVSIAFAVGTSMSFFYTAWLTGPALVNGTNDASKLKYFSDYVDWNKYKDVEFSFSTFRRCNYWSVAESKTKVFTVNNYSVVEECGRYRDFSGPLGIPSVSWQVCTLMAGSATAVLILVALVGLLAVCVNGVFGNRCIAVCTALVQFACGLALVGTVLLFPVGWDAERLRMEACGWDAGKYQIGRCSLGWCYYVTLCCAIGVMVTAIISPAKCGESSDDDDPLPAYMI